MHTTYLKICILWNDRQYRKPPSQLVVGKLPHKVGNVIPSMAVELEGSSMKAPSRIA